MRKTPIILSLIALALCKGPVFGQGLNLELTGSSLGRLEAGVSIVDTTSPVLVWNLNFGAGDYYDIYTYIGAGLNLQLYRNFGTYLELYPVLSTRHKTQTNRGNNMVGDELMFGTRVRAGTQYTIQLWPKLDLVTRAGLELECPVFATRNAAAEFRVQGYVGLGLVLHAL